MTCLPIIVWRRVIVLVFAAVIGLTLSPSPTVAQPRTGVLRVTVTDPSGAVIVGATVTVGGAEAATRAAEVAPVPTSDTGVAIVSGLAPGRYVVDAVFPGFQKRTLPDVRVRAGDNRQSVMLDIEKVEASVTVGQDQQSAASDRQGPSFGTALTRDQIDALSDDPSTFQKQLQDMAGPGAVIRIDGFEGSALPAKAQIRSIRIARDQFAAEFHSAGGVSIEIITQPGLGPIRYFSQFQTRGDGLSGRSPFVPTRGPEQNLNYGIGLGGTLIKEKRFNLNVFGNSAYDTPNLNAALPTGTLSRALGVKALRDNLFVNGQLDYALTLDQTLRVGYNLNRFAADNLGIGGYDEPERAFSTNTLTHNLRVQHFGPLGRRMFARTRVQLIWSDNESQSALEAPTIRVLDAFTRGGAQRAGGDHSRLIDVGSDVDYVLGRHSFRAGVVANGGWLHSNANSNYLGQYTYDDLEAYPNRPSHYTRRIGNPDISYRNLQAGIYLQDDIRLRKNLTITPGVRYEIQTHVGDAADFGPRFGVTWAPFAGGQTTFRSSAGVFYDWLPSGTYDQTQRVDGFHQQELNVVNPDPDLGIGGTVPPVNRYELSGDYHMPRTTRISGGVDQQLLKTTRVSATYSYQQGSRVARGLQLNPIVDGARRNSTFSNVIAVVSDAESRVHQLQIDASVNPGALLPAFRGPRISWKRTTLFANYTLASVRNNTDGPFSIPATGVLADEWGPANGAFATGPFFGDFGGPPPLNRDIRNRLNLNFNNQIIRNFLVGFNMNRSTAPPYTLLSGSDDNGDGIFNDRPAGVGRNTLRASGQTTINMNVGYVFAFGRTAALPPGIGVFGSGNAAQVRTIDQGTARYRLQVFVNAQNLTNQRNYVGYSGTMTSPFFGKPTAVSGMRKIDVGVGINF